ncbi:MAG: DUF5597 domain-containing protein [Acidobacteria bacterium]|nr:DUF5597 domain-containing protein [Acidobacteriota bacterium]MBW4045859.1 DUF5597 domain-containing protein [Acidobacteriota bacterium]
MRINFLPGLLVCLVLLSFAPLSPAQSTAPATPADMPHISRQDGRFALMVDGAPYLVLGAQMHNSSAWASVLPKVWPWMEAMHVNTVAAPVYWEQIEATEGKFDFTEVDALVNQAREHHLHLILLWFGTWKNGQMRYTPRWVKMDGSRFPRMRDAHGEPIEVLSANSSSNLDADKKAFSTLMRHLKQLDGDQHTVIMVQVENESGAIGSVRDYSAMAEKQFEGTVPEALLKGLHKTPGTWKQVFGGDADETFQAYSVSRYIDEVAKAGKAEYPLPMYVNVWVSYPIRELPERRIPTPGISYPSGGAVQSMLNLWKMETPDIDIIGPDIYSSDGAFYREILRTYSRPDNPLWIPETGSGDDFGRYFFTALGMGAIGFSPFGVDSIDATVPPGGLPGMHAENYALIGPMDREIAALNFEGKLKTAVEEEGQAVQTLNFGKWQATIGFGYPQRDGMRPPGTKDFHGRALVAQLGPDKFLVTGFDASITFQLTSPGHEHMQILQAEEGSYRNGKWQPLRILNGDETDRGLNFRHQGSVAQIELGTF